MHLSDRAGFKLVIEQGTSEIREMDDECGRGRTGVGSQWWLSNPARLVKRYAEVGKTDFEFRTMRGNALETGHLGMQNVSQHQSPALPGGTHCLQDGQIVELLHIHPQHSLCHVNVPPLVQQPHETGEA